MLAAWLEHAQKFYFGKFPAELFIETKSSKRSSFFASEHIKKQTVHRRKN